MEEVLEEVKRVKVKHNIIPTVEAWRISWK
jgi:hypothetical protein